MKTIIDTGLDIIIEHNKTKINNIKIYWHENESITFISLDRGVVSKIFEAIAFIEDKK